MTHLVTLRLCCALIAAATVLASCSKEPEYTDEQRVCITERFPKYNARDINQCVAACKTCRDGNTITCNTSCRLRGAS